MKKLLLLVVAMLTIGGSAHAITVPELSSPEACQKNQKCDRWYGLDEKPAPDACQPAVMRWTNCHRWYSVGAPKAPIKIVLNGIRFDTGKATIRPESLPILEKNVKTLKEAGKVKIRIIGHTDNRGSDAANQSLSERRAESARNYFIQNGIDGSRMTAEGRGESEPIASNDTDAGRFQNRRIEIEIK